MQGHLPSRPGAARGRQGIRCTISVRAAPCLIVQRPLRFLAIESEFGSVLDAQHDRMVLHAFAGAFPMRSQDTFPRHLIFAEKAVGRTDFVPTVAGFGNARRRLRCKSFHQCSRSFVEASIAQVRSRKLLIRPAARYLGQYVTQSQRVNGISPTFTSPSGNSLNVNGFLDDAGPCSRLMYNGMVIPCTELQPYRHGQERKLDPNYPPRTPNNLTLIQPAQTHLSGMD